MRRSVTITFVIITSYTRFEGTRTYNYTRTIVRFTNEYTLVGVCESYRRFLWSGAARRRHEDQTANALPITRHYRVDNNTTHCAYRTEYRVLLLASRSSHLRPSPVTSHQFAVSPHPQPAVVTSRRRVAHSHSPFSTPAQSVFGSVSGIRIPESASLITVPLSWHSGCARCSSVAGTPQLKVAWKYRIVSSKESNF